MASSVRAVQGISKRKKALPQTLPIKLSLVVGKKNHIDYWKYDKKNLIFLKSRPDHCNAIMFNCAHHTTRGHV